MDNSSLNHEQITVCIEGNSMEIGPNLVQTVRSIGSGRNAVVELVKHKINGTFCVVKRVQRLNFKTNMSMMREFEVLKRASTDCKEIIDFYGALLWNNQLHIYLQFMQASLDGYYKEIYKKQATDTPPIPEPVLGRIAASTVSGLEFLLNKHNILHRDVKPANILTNWKGDVKLCDFNSSCVSSECISKSMAFSGTLAYAAPEVHLQRQYTEKSDVWSLGITLLEIASGQLPFKETKEYELQLEIKNGEVPKLPEGRYSNGCRDFIDLCLKKEWDQRSTYDELLKLSFVKENKTFDISGFSNPILDSLNNKLWAEN